MQKNTAENNSQSAPRNGKYHFDVSADAVQQIVKQFMVRSVHYRESGPHAKPALLKPGSEVLLSAFGIAAKPHITTEHFDGHTIYTVTCEGIHRESAQTVGYGVGTASTGEEVAAWRPIVCMAEYNDTPEALRRTKWYLDKSGKPDSILEVRTNPADASNSALKIAKKRAQVDMVLTTLRCSDLFTQDIEDGTDRTDIPAEAINQATQAEVKERQAPGKGRKPAGSKLKEKAAATAAKRLTKAQVTMLRMRLANSEKEETALCAEFKVNMIEALTHGQFNSVLDWIAA